MADALQSFPTPNLKEIKKVTTSERSRGTCCAPFTHATVGVSHALPRIGLSSLTHSPTLVIPPAPACRGSEAEGPAVRPTRTQMPDAPHLNLHHPKPAQPPPRSPRPLKIEPPKLPCHINHLSNEVKPWNLAALHRACAQLGSVHSARRDFSLLIAFRPGRIDSPAMKRALRLLESLVRPRGRWVQRQPPVSQPMRQDPSDRASCIRKITLRWPRAKFLGPQPVRREIDHHSLPRLPIRRNLQHRRPAKPAMGEQQLFPKPPRPGRSHNLEWKLPPGRHSA